jgi:hypothetical protein
MLLSNSATIRTFAANLLLSHGADPIRRNHMMFRIEHDDSTFL